MSTINNKNYSSPRNINLKDGCLRFGATQSGSPFDSTSNGLYINSSNQLVFSSQGSGTTVGATGITFTGTGANGGVLKNLKNSAATALSGTQLDVAIDIGGVPYYFTVYPTKA